MPFVFPKKNAFGALIAAHYFFLSLFPLTAQTPTRLSQANAGGGNSFGYEQSLVINDQYFFYGSTPATGVELWVSDGTVAGTRLVKDINPGTGSGASAIAGAAFKNKIWFQGKTPESGTELWCSDGQENGTKMIETAAGSANGAPILLTPGRNYLFFAARDDNGDMGIWRTDGTQTGTKLIIPGSKFNYASAIYYNELAAIGDSLYLVVDGSIYFSNGSAAGTVLLKNISITANLIGDSELIGQKLYFSANDFNPFTDFEPYVSDGTAAGTMMLKDIVPDDGSYPVGFFPFKNKVYFMAANRLWQTDGTPTGTVQFLPNQMFFRGLNRRLFASDDRYFYFPYSDSATGCELWRSDGTLAGTQMVCDLSPGAASSNPQELCMAAGLLYFSGATAGIQHELCVSDGTATGTKQISNLSNADDGARPRRLYQVGNKLLFIATPGDVGAPRLYALELTTAVSAPTPINLKVFPNPATGDFVEVAIPSDCSLRGARLQLIDAGGRSVWQSSVDTRQCKVPIKGIVPGVCLLLYTDASGSSGRITLVVP